MQKFRLKRAFLIAVVVIVLFAVNDYFHVSGKDFSWADLVGDEAVITVEETYKASGKVIAAHTLTKGQSLALQTLLLRTDYLRSFADGVRLEPGEPTYDIFIRFPERDVSLHLTGSRYLSGSGEGLLKIVNKEWETIFQGILAAG